MGGHSLLAEALSLSDPALHESYRVANPDFIATGCPGWDQPTFRPARFVLLKDAEYQYTVQRVSLSDPQFGIRIATAKFGQNANSFHAIC